MKQFEEDVAGAMAITDIHPLLHSIDVEMKVSTKVTSKPHTGALLQVFQSVSNSYELFLSKKEIKKINQSIKKPSGCLFD